MGCILNALFFAFLFIFIVALYVVTIMWTQIKQMRDVFLGKADRNRNSMDSDKNSNPPKSTNKIFAKNQGEYVDFEEVQ